MAWICGFANAQGGILEIGKDDNGEIVGVRNVLSLLEDIPSKVQSLLGIVVEVKLKSESGLEYIEIVVEPHSNPISYRGKFHYRSGSTKQVLQGAALTRFLLEWHGRTWDDVALPGVKLSELDGRAFNGFRRLGVKCERLPPEALDDSDEDVIERLRLREGAFLKRTAALLFHPSPHQFVPGAYVKIGCFHGPDLLFQDVVRGDVFTQVDRTMDLLYTKYTRGLISYDGIYRVETFPVPRWAMREAVINAVVHRNYASHVPLRIRVRDDRISIWNAARLTPGWRADRLAEEHSSRPHNPQLAHAFFRAGLIEAWGWGIRRMLDTCREVGSPTPTWRPEGGGDGLRVTFPFSEAYRAADAAARGTVAPRPGDNQNRQKTARNGDQPPEDHQKPAATTRKQPESLPLPERILAVLRPDTTQEESGTTPLTTAVADSTTGKTTGKTTAKRIPALLRRDPEISLAAVASRVGLTVHGVRYHIRKLKSAGAIRRVGSSRAGRWEVLK